MLKKYKAFKDYVNERNSWMRFCQHHMLNAMEYNNKESEDFWAKNYIDTMNDRNQMLGSNIKYAVIYKLTHKGT